MALAGYEPSEAANLWRRMMKVHPDSMPDFFSTHPSSGKRVKRLEKLQGKYRALYDAAPQKYGLGENL